MGNAFATKIKVELYKWSSSEFPQEYALIYTLLDDESKTSTFRLSVNTDKVLCRLTDNFCEDHPTQFQLKVTAERDHNGDYNFGQVLLGAKGTFQNRFVQHHFLRFSYLCEKRTATYYMVRSIEQNVGRVNLKKTSWELCHSYDVGFKTELKCSVNVQCNKMKGLCVGFTGPYRYKGLVFQKQDGLQIQREIRGEPPGALNANVATEFEEEEVYLLFQSGEGNQNGANMVSLQATGLINNIDGHTQDFYIFV
ncbi:hypothetical protein CR513_24264, partial [Mucuna pruriens]